MSSSKFENLEPKLLERPLVVGCRIGLKQLTFKGPMLKPFSDLYPSSQTPAEFII